MNAQLETLRPDWPAPAHVHAIATTRAGGCSQGNYSGLNLADHVGDEPQHVGENRKQLTQALKLPEQPRWLTQVHGAKVVRAENMSPAVEADACVSGQPDQVCAVLTADCLPVLLTDTRGLQVAAIHAGWRGLCAGAVENTLAEFTAVGIAADELMAWLGPAIGPQVYEVDEPVREVFAARIPDCLDAFREARPGHWYLDLYAAARVYLADQGVSKIYGGDFCTYSDPRFFSYRREIPCGRQATLIWLELDRHRYF